MFESTSLEAPVLRSPVVALVTAVDALVTGDPMDLTFVEQADEIAALAQARDRIEARRLALLGAVQASGAWSAGGARSARAWLRGLESSSDAAAGADLRLAGALREHLLLAAESLRNGQLSVGKARVLARAALGSQLRRDAMADPNRGEALLLEHAPDHEIGEFGQLVRRWAYRVDPDADDNAYREAAAGRELHLSRTAEGTLLHGWLAPVDAEVVATALQAQIGVPDADDRRTPGQRRADALVSMCQRLLDSGSVGRHASVRPQLVVQVSYQALVAAADGCGVDPAELPGTGQALPRGVLDRLACDCEVTRIVFGPQSQVLDVGRAQRTFTGPLRRALDARDGGCLWGRCNAPPSQCEGHHSVSWLRGGPTSVDNGVLLCWHHHDLLHSREYVITRDVNDGAWVIRDRHGTVISARLPRAGQLQLGERAA